MNKVHDLDREYAEDNCRQLWAIVHWLNVLQQSKEALSHKQRVLALVSSAALYS